MTAEDGGGAGRPPATQPQEFGRYRVLRELGRGGMGVVYQARHTVMNRQVVIKVVNKALLDNPDAMERFRREVQAAAQLSHPNIVTAYDAEQAGDTHFLVMEFVPGQSLAEVLHKKGPLPVVHACHYVRQAALGLQHAHERGMVHRDIKPHNLMLTPKGQVKVLDFGLAKVVSEGRPKQTLTALNSYMGTPEYTAPEQATDARSADIRADLYSLGCTLYCLLAGHPPFREETAVKAILAHLEQEPRPLPELRPDVPAALWAVVARLLAKDPARRYQTPGEVARALAPFCKKGQRVGSGPAAAPSAASSRRGTVATINTGQSPRVPAPAVKGRAPSPAAGEPATQPGPATLAARRRLPGRTWLALGVAALALAVTLGSVIYVSTNKGTIKIELIDPKSEVEIAVDGDTVSLTRLDEPLRLKVGDHALVVTGKTFETVSRSFTVKRGDNPVLRITLPDDKQAAEKPSPPAWVPLVPSEWQLKHNKNARFENELLDIGGNGGSHIGFSTYAKDMTIRARVRTVGEQNTGHLALQLRNGPAGFYTAYYSRGGRIRIDLFDKNKQTGTNLGVSDEAFQFDDFFEFTFSAVGNRLTALVSGKKVLEVTDSTLPVGACAVQAYDRAGQYKDMAVQVLDPPLPRNRWVRLDPADGELSRGSCEKGLVSLGANGQLEFPTVRGRNMTIRARVKKTDGDGRLIFGLRYDPETMLGYGAAFSRRREGDSYDFTIGKTVREGDDLQFPDLKSSGGMVVPDLDPDDFFELSFSAVDDLLTVGVNGKPVVEVRDPDYKEGTVRVGSWLGKALLEKIEVKVLDEPQAGPGSR
jgi:tRNA A-37 threonylcarbamoyl transferase component Bud32